MSDIEQAITASHIYGVIHEAEEQQRRGKKKEAAFHALNFLQTVAANLNNEAINDEEFRDFMRRSMTGMPGIEYPKN